MPMKKTEKEWSETGGESQRTFWNPPQDIQEVSGVLKIQEVAKMLMLNCQAK